MDKNKTSELFGLMMNGSFSSEEELSQYITDENKLREVYAFIPDGFFSDTTEYVEYFKELVKKKKESLYPEEEYSFELSGQSRKPLGDILAGTSSPSRPEVPATPTPSPSPEESTSGGVSGDELVDKLLPSMSPEGKMTVYGDRMRTKANQLRSLTQLAEGQEFREKVGGIGETFQRAIQTPAIGTDYRAEKAMLEREMDEIKSKVHDEYGTKGLAKLSVHQRLSPEEAEAFSRAVDRLDAELGENSPYARRDSMNRVVEEEIRSLDPSEFPNTSEGIAQMEARVKEIVGAQAWNHGFLLQDNGNVVDRWNREQKLEEYAGEEMQVGIGESLLYKTAAGIEGVAGGLIDLVGMATGLNYLKPYREAREGAYFNANTFSEKGTRYDKTAEEYLNERDYLSAAGALLTNTVESLPYMIPMMLNPAYGTYVVGGVAGARKYRDLQGEDMREWERAINAVVTGASEMLFERIFTTPILMNSKRAISELGEKAVRENVQRGSKRMVNDVIHGVTERSKEGFSEWLTTVAENAVDKVTYDPDRKLTDGAVDAFLSGVLMYDIMTSPQKALWVRNKYNNIEARREYAKVLMAQTPVDLPYEQRVDAASKLAERDIEASKDAAVRNDMKVAQLEVEVGNIVLGRDTKEGKVEQVEGDAPTYEVEIGGKKAVYTTPEALLDAIKPLNPDNLTVRVSNDVGTADQVTALLKQKQADMATQKTEVTPISPNGEIVAQDVAGEPVESVDESVQTKTTEDAVQERKAEEVDVRQQAEIGEEMGGEVWGEAQAETEVEGKTLAASAETGAIVASFDMTEVAPDGREAQLKGAREALDGFLQRVGKDLGLTEKQWANYTRQALKVKTPAGAQKLIDKMLAKSTEQIQVQNYEQKRQELRDMFKADEVKRKVAQAKAESPSAMMQEMVEATKAWKKENRAALESLPRRMREAVERRLSNISLSPRATTNSLDSVIDFVSRALTDQQYVDRVNRIGKKLDAVKDVAGDINSILNRIPDLNLRAKYLFGKGELKVLLNKLDITHEAFTDAMLDKLDKALDGLMPKNGEVQKAEPVMEFLQEYHDSVVKMIDDSVADPVANEDDADNIRGRINKLAKDTDQMMEGMKDGTTTLDELRQFSANLSRLEGVIAKLYREGSISKEAMVIHNTALAELSDVLNEDFGDMVFETRRQYQEALKAYKIDVLRGMEEVNLPDQPVMQREGGVVNADVAYLKKNPDALEWARVGDIDYLAKAVEEMNQTGIVPDRFFDVQARIRTAVTAHSYTQMYDRMGKVRGFYERWIKRLTAKDLAAKYTTRLDIDFGILGEFSSPYWENVGFDHKRAKAISDRQTLDDLKTIDVPLRAALGYGWREKYVSNRLTRRQEVILNRIGHVWKNLREYQNRQMPTPVKDGDKWAIPSESKDYVSPRFDTREAAVEHFMVNKELYTDGLDLIQRDIESGDLDRAQFSSRKAYSEYKKRIYLDAYNQLKKDNPNMVVKSMDDAKKLLTPEEFKLMQAIQQLNDSKRAQARVTGLREGKSLVFEASYMPFFQVSPEGRVAASVGDAMELPLDSYMQKGGIKPAGSIYEKMERTNYVVNSNILSATERYVSHLNTSYNMLPTMRAQLGAFTAWGNRFAKLAKQEGPDKAKYNTLRQVSDALAKDLKSRYERDVTFGGLFTGDRIGMRIGDQYVDFTTGLESVRKVARVVALVDVVRPILDLGPQEFRQFVEQGVAGFNLGRVQDLIPLYDYTPEGSFGKEFRTDLLNRYQSIGDRTGRMTKTEEWTQTYLALADRVSRQQAWATKFDEVYAQLSGERVDMERFKTDAKYKADVVGSESFERAVKLADQYQSRIHFADTAGAAGGEILGGVLKYGSKGYALFTPLSSYMLNQYYDAVAHGKMLLHGTGSDEWMSNRKATVKAAQGLGGAFANTMAYTYMSGLSRMGTMIAVYGLLGRPDLAEEEKEKLEDMFSWRGVGVNAISSAFSIIQSGGAQLGATLLTLTADVMEGAILSNVATNIEKKEMKALIKAIRQSAGVIQYQQFDFEREQMGTRSMANLVFPVGGTFLYDTMKGIGQGALFAIRERGERAEMIPLREDEQLLAFVRAATLLGVGMISGFPGSKDLDRLMKGLERSAKSDPYWPNIEDKRSFLSMKGAIESEVERISTNPHLLYKPNGQLRTVEDFRTLADDVAKEYLETKKRFDGLDGKKSYYDILHGMELNKDGIAWLDALYTDIKDSRKLEPKQKYEMFQLLDGVYEDMQKGVWNGEFVQVWSKTTKVFRDNFDREFLDDVVISVSKEMRKAETQVKGFKK